MVARSSAPPAPSAVDTQSRVVASDAMLRSGDVVVTSDIPLAARCLKAGARVLGTTGRVFTEDSIGDLVATRDLKAVLREAGIVPGGPPPMSPRDRSRFLSRLDELVQKGLREQRASLRR